MKAITKLARVFFALTFLLGAWLLGWIGITMPFMSAITGAGVLVFAAFLTVQPLWSKTGVKHVR